MSKSKTLLKIGYVKTSRSQKTALTDRTGSKDQREGHLLMKKYSWLSIYGLKSIVRRSLGLLEAMAAMVLMVVMAVTVLMAGMVLMVALAPLVLASHWWNNAMKRLFG
jgi:hypothetical protein